MNAPVWLLVVRESSSIDADRSSPSGGRQPGTIQHLANGARSRRGNKHSKTEAKLTETHMSPHAAGDIASTRSVRTCISRASARGRLRRTADDSSGVKPRFPFDGGGAEPQWLSSEAGSHSSDLARIDRTMDVGRSYAPLERPRTVPPSLDRPFLTRTVLAICCRATKRERLTAAWRHPDCGRLQ